jgi:uncharacterized protein YdaU (DUF1376 family)
VSSKPATSPPYFKFYPRDFADGVAHLSPAQRGAYISLLCHQWTAKAVPGDDVAQLRRIIGADSSREAAQIWEALKGKFERQDDGRYVNARLEVERVKVEELFAKQAANGAKGGRPKKSTNPPLNPNRTHGKPVGLAVANRPGNPTESHPDPDPKPEPRPVSSTYPRSEISPPSTVSAQRERTGISSPSDAQANAGWTLWEKVKTWLDTHPDISPTGRSYFAKVYAAVLTNERLELVFDDATIARGFWEGWSAMVAEAIAAAGHPGLVWRPVSRRRDVTTSKVTA